MRNLFSCIGVISQKGRGNDVLYGHFCYCFHHHNTYPRGTDCKVDCKKVVQSLQTLEKATLMQQSEVAFSRN